MDLSIIIPAYNEMFNIEETISTLYNLIVKKAKLKAELIVIDDASWDLTPFLIKNIKHIKVLTNKVNKGKGYSVKKGITEAKGKYIAIFDADMPYNAECILKAYSMVDKYDVIYGKRVGKGEYPALRYFASNIFRFITRHYLKLESSDSQCGFKLFKKSLIEKADSIITLNRFSYDIQLAYYFKSIDAVCFNMGITVQKHSASSVNFLSDGLRLVCDLWRIKHGLC